MKLKFIYGDIPFWRAEVGRLALYFGNIDFEDIRIPRELLAFIISVKWLAAVLEISKSFEEIPFFESLEGLG